MNNNISTEEQEMIQSVVDQSELHLTMLQSKNSELFDFYNPPLPPPIIKKSSTQYTPQQPPDPITGLFRQPSTIFNRVNDAYIPRNRPSSFQQYNPNNSFIQQESTQVQGIQAIQVQNEVHGTSAISHFNQKSQFVQQVPQVQKQEVNSNKKSEGKRSKGKEACQKESDSSSESESDSNFEQSKLKQGDLQQSQQSRPQRSRNNTTKNSKKQRSRSGSKSQPVGTQPCTCTKSQCLQMYCSCFHGGKRCGDECKCIGCKNTPVDDQNVQHAKAHIEKKAKRIRQKNEHDLFNLAAVLGCKCTKTKCQKGYCECFIRKAKCTEQCQCENCENGKDENIDFNDNQYLFSEPPKRRKKKKNRFLQKTNQQKKK